MLLIREYQRNLYIIAVNIVVLYKACIVMLDLNFLRIIRFMAI